MQAHELPGAELPPPALDSCTGSQKNGRAWDPGGPGDKPVSFVLGNVAEIGFLQMGCFEIAAHHFFFYLKNFNYSFEI